MYNIDQRIIDGFNQFSPFDLGEGKLLMLGMVGSHAHGTYIPKDDPDSIDDVDFFGVVLPPQSYTFGLESVYPGTWKSTVFKYEELDCTFYSFKHFMYLLEKGNPTILSALWLPVRCYIHLSDEFKYLISKRDIFSSKQSFHAFQGTAKSHFIKMIQKSEFLGYMGQKRKELVTRYGYDTKSASHALRIIKMGTEFFSTGTLNVDRTDIDAKFLKMVKSGEYSLQEVKELWEISDTAIVNQYINTRLPNQPDAEKMDKIIQTINLNGYGLDRFDFGY